MAKKKAGRPKIDNPKGEVIRVRVVPKTATALAAYQKQHALVNQSEVIRRIVNAALAREGLL